MSVLQTCCGSTNTLLPRAFVVVKENATNRNGVERGHVKKAGRKVVELQVVEHQQVVLDRRHKLCERVLEAALLG